MDGCFPQMFSCLDCKMYCSFICYNFIYKHLIFFKFTYCALEVQIVIFFLKIKNKNSNIINILITKKN